MDLILWRHADAGDAVDDPKVDLERRLTDRGRKQADRVARWLLARLPERYLVLASPAARARETAAALGVKARTEPRIAPGLDVADHLAALNWPEGPEGRTRYVVLVGHQPALGRLASLLLSGAEADWSVKKGAAWWLSTREREGRAQIVLRAVIGPDLV
ncbi:histidine phosphatase family protein [Burkholderiaceae bacterium FT117]|uniref:SixA phosphatase family protein n=1 Tax=Zeimonas sediminis TaxID=2944268 RepID=UPI002342D26B|nr:histidine phosphatase family protein [Zeimonas sediminis]MCM5571715.1 histidine phosphatase family protein [Zeimonas sediminis]